MIRNVPDCYKNQQIYNKVVDNYSHALEFSIRLRKICDKAVNTHPSTIQFVPECYKIQEMCDESAFFFFFVFDSISDQYKTQKMCNRVVSEDLLLIVYSPIYIKLKGCAIKLLMIL